MTPANILLLVADDHQAAAFGRLDPQVSTPHLDGLAARGATFNRAYHSGSPVGAVCVPTRACLLTSRRLPAAVVEPWTDLRLRPEVPLLPQWFAAAGYETHHVGKWHNSAESLHRAFGRGAEVFIGGMAPHESTPVRPWDETGHFPDDAAEPGRRFSTDLFADAAIDFLRLRPQRRPFFLHLAFTAPHDPRTPPPEFAAQYPPASVRLPPSFRPEHPFDNGSLEVRDEMLLPRPLAPHRLQEEMAAYFGLVTHLDHAIGRILHALTETGELERTLVVYTSDHGLALGRHGLLGKQNCYEPSVRVPLILAGPGVPKGSHHALFESIDLGPTLAELAGVATPSGLEGRSAAAVIRGETDRHRDYAHCFHRREQRMVTDGRWKLIEYRLPTGARYQVFDLESDPEEQCDLSESPLGREVADALGPRIEA